MGTGGNSLTLSVPPTWWGREGGTGSRMACVLTLGHRWLTIYVEIGWKGEWFLPCLLHRPLQGSIKITHREVLVAQHITHVKKNYLGTAWRHGKDRSAALWRTCAQIPVLFLTSCDLVLWKSLCLNFVIFAMGRIISTWHVYEGKREWYLRSSWHLVGTLVTFSPFILLCHFIRECHCISFLLLS